MSLRFEGIARLGLAATVLTLACSSSNDPAGSGSGGGASGAAGTSAGATSSGGSSSGNSGMAGSGMAGSSAGTSTSAGNAAGGGAGTSMGGAAAGTAGNGGGGGGEKSKTTFFVTSDTIENADMGGLDGADKRCQDLAQAAGFGDHTFKAYLSTSTVNAKDRIGAGPWFNSKGVMLAESVAALHAMDGNDDLFLDEKGMKINGQWTGSPQPNQHDILTGSNPDGTVAEGKTCADWTSDSEGSTVVGHADGLGPRQNDMENPNPPYNSWNSVHDNQGCGNLTPGGGAGKIYCFAID